MKILVHNSSLSVALTAISILFSLLSLLASFYLLITLGDNRTVLATEFIVIDDSENSIVVLDRTLATHGTIRVRKSDGTWGVVQLVVK